MDSLSKAWVMTRSLPAKLRDVHAPARIVQDEVHWQMAAGPEAVDVSVTAAALGILGPRPLPAVLNAFEQTREVLCELAALKYATERGGRHIRLDKDDVTPALDYGALPPLNR